MSDDTIFTMQRSDESDEAYLNRAVDAFCDLVIEAALSNYKTNEQSNTVYKSFKQRSGQ